MKPMILMLLFSCFLTRLAVAQVDVVEQPPSLSLSPYADPLGGKRPDQVSDCLKKTKQQLMALSAEAYREYNNETCACSNDKDIDGVNRCGDRSARVRQNGALPLCSVSDLFLFNDGVFARSALALCEGAIRNPTAISSEGSNKENVKDRLPSDDP